MAKFIPCDGPHGEPTEWDWQIVRRDGEVNTMLCDEHFAGWAITFVQAVFGEGDGAPAEPAPEPAASSDAGAPVAAAAEAGEAAHRARTRRKLAARPAGAKTSLAVAPEPGTGDE